MKEVWKDITGYEGHYQVSNLGRVKSLERIAPNQRNCRAFVSERILKERKKKSGYLQVALSKNGKYKHISIHSLVAQEFLGHNPDGGNTQVDHIDRDKSNNRVDNLQVLSRKEHYKKTCSDLNVTSKYPGVYWNKNRGVWQSQIKHKGKNYYLGQYKDEMIGVNAYRIGYSNKELLEKDYEKFMVMLKKKLIKQ